MEENKAQPSDLNKVTYNKGSIMNNKERREHQKKLRKQVRDYRLLCNPQTPFLKKGSVDQEKKKR